jgi:hypothetical protein
LQSHARTHARTCTQPRAVGVNGKGRPPHLQVQNIPHFPRSTSAGVCSPAPFPPHLSPPPHPPLCPSVPRLLGRLTPVLKMSYVCMCVNVYVLTTAAGFSCVRGVFFVPVAF